MRRLLTGYAVSFNRRHRQIGHLFQNRYKSILCQEDAYLLELVRYIHLNPIRAHVVENIETLDHYPYSGHSAVMGKIERQWQNVSEVLELFGDRTGTARRRYRIFVEKGAMEGRRPELVGGGLIRSSGGWEAVKVKRRAKLFEKSDERILGNGDFVEMVLAASNEQMKRKYHLRAKGVDLETVAARVSELTDVDKAQIFLPGKERNRVRARSLFCYWAVRELGISISEISRKLEMSLAGENQSLKRSKRMADCNGIVTDFSLEPKSVTMNFSNIRQCNHFLTAYLVIKRIILFKQLQLTYNHNIANLLISNTNKELMIDLQNAAW